MGIVNVMKMGIVIIVFRYFMHPDKQIVTACQIINNDPMLANGFNAIGFSQGAQFL